MTSCISNALCLSMCTSVPVFSTESSSLSSSGSRTAKLTDNHIPLGTDQEEDLRTLARNTSLETISLRGYLGKLQTQVSSLCGEDGQLGQLRTNLGAVNTSTTLLQDSVKAFRLLKGSYCKTWAGPTRLIYLTFDIKYEYTHQRRYTHILGCRAINPCVV